MSDISRTDLPELTYFLGGYLHQDWPEDYGSSTVAARTFVDENTPEVVDRFLADIATLLT